MLIPIVIHGYVDSVAENDDQIEELGIFVSKIGLDTEVSVSDADVAALTISPTLH